MATPLSRPPKRPAASPVVQELRGPERRPRRGLGVLWVAILAMLGTAAFGLVTISDDDIAASTEPADAVKRLLRAASDRDALGALEVVLPAERAVIRQPLVELTSEANRLGLLADADLSDVGGVDFKFENVTMATESLADGIAKVRSTGGKVTTVGDPRRVPIGPVLRDAGVDLSGEEPETEVTDLATSPFEIVTVRDGDKWYVSIAYSIAESARKDAGAPLPNFGQGIPARGEPSAKQAVDTALRAALALDIERLIALVSPGEGRALRDYAPLFIEDAKAGAAQARRSFSATVSSLELSEVSSSGGEARVAIERFDVALRIEGETGRFNFDGECTTVSVPGQPQERMCANDALKALPFLGVLPDGSGFEKLTVSAVEADGAWYLSPTRTMTGLLLDLTGQLDRQKLTELIRGFTEGFGAQAAVNEA